jgi:hypothetical protein
MMLTRNSDLGQIEITLCSGIGERNVWLDLDTGSLSDNPRLSDHSSDEDDDHATANQLCSFAVVTAIALPQNPIIESHGSTSPLHNSVTQNPTIRRYPGGTLPPRGPPPLS